jgi:hypothetical protein
MNLFEVSKEISNRLTRIFLRDESGRRPVYGATEKFQSDPFWRDYIYFFECFHGDNGAGLGASHQTGWTGLVAKLLELYGFLDPKRSLEIGSFAQTFFHSLLRVVFLALFDRCIDDHGSLIIFRSARVVIYAYKYHVRLLSPEPGVVDKPQSTRVEEEPTLLCNQVDFSSVMVGTVRHVSELFRHRDRHSLTRATLRNPDRIACRFDSGRCVESIPEYGNTCLVAMYAESRDFAAGILCEDELTARCAHAVRPFYRLVDPDIDRYSRFTRGIDWNAIKLVEDHVVHIEHAIEEGNAIDAPQRRML